MYVCDRSLNNYSLLIDINMVLGVINKTKYVLIVKADNTTTNTDVTRSSQQSWPTNRNPPQEP